MVFRLKIVLFSAYLSVVVVFVDGQAKQRKLTETHFPKFHTSTANRRSYVYMKPSPRVKITIIFSSIRLPLTLRFFVNPAFTYTLIFSSLQLSLTRTIGPS